MTPEEKQLLLKELCARLPYGVKLNFYASAMRENYTCTLLGINPNDNRSIIAKVDTGAFKFPAEHIKLYLRPLSSMTREERLVYEQRLHDVGRSVDVIDADEVVSHIDWLLSNHFDFRGLIPKGLALEAPDGMYKNNFAS